jgi:hypothetical protein
MSVNHGGFDVFVAEEFLHGVDVVACLQNFASLHVGFTGTW